jgi:hypothetical protein
VQLLTCGTTSALAVVDPDILAFRARFLLAIALVHQRRHADAEREAREVVRVRPDFAPAWLALGEALKARSDHAGVADVVAALDAMGFVDPELDALREALHAGA